MVQYCVMVKGPCRGKSCDFWARVKIRKLTVNELITDIREHIKKCNKDSSMSINEILRIYWSEVGMHDLDKLCCEEPDLCAKMIDAEVKAQIL